MLRSYNQLRFRQSAMQVINDARAITRGWKNYRDARNGNFQLSDINWSDGTATDLTTTYLNKLPTPPQGVALSTMNYYFPIKLSNFATSSGISTATDVDTVALRISNVDVCNWIAKLKDGGTPTVKASAGGSDNALSGDLSAVSTRRAYDCIYYDTDGSGGLNTGDAMIFFYSLY